MQTILSFALKNKALVNLVVIMLIGLGMLAYHDLVREVFPDFALPKILIRAVDVGTGAHEMEQAVAARIEREIDDLEGVLRIASESREGVSLIFVTLKAGRDIDELKRDIEDRIARMDNLPERLATPKVIKLKNRFPVITVSLAGSIAELDLNELAAEWEKRLLKIPGVAAVQMTGQRERRVLIALEPESLEAFGIGPAEVQYALARRNLQVPGGKITQQRHDFLIETTGKFSRLEQIEDLVVRALPDGRRVCLRDVAQVRLALAPAKTLGRFNGQQAINFIVFKEKEADSIRLAKRIRQWVAQQPLPAGMQAGVYNDTSLHIAERLRIMEENALIGLTLVLISLWAFMNTRIALMTALGIPTAIIGTFIFMQFLGISVNMVSIFAFIVVLGMLVDDAIVVTENVYRHIEQGQSLEQAALDGTLEVATSVIASVVTTIAAFLPLLVITGKIGNFSKVIPKVVTIALLLSLVEALWVLPSHLVDFLNIDKIRRRTQRRQLMPWVIAHYQRLLGWLLHWRYAALAVFVSLAMVFSIFALRKLPLKLFGSYGCKQFFINVELPPGAALAQTSAKLRAIEELVQAHQPRSDIEATVVNVGLAFETLGRIRRGSNIGQILVDLSPKRRHSTDAIMQSLRQQAALLPGFASIEFSKIQPNPAGRAIEVIIVGADLPVMIKAAQAVKDYLRGFPAVKDIRDEVGYGATRVRIQPRPHARHLGLDNAELARQIRAAFHGVEAGRYSWHGEDLALWICYQQPPSGYDIHQLEQMQLLLGRPPRQVPLSEVASLRLERGYAKILHENGMRAVTVTADVDTTQGNTHDITRDLLAHFQNFSTRFPGCQLSLRGEKEETDRLIAAVVKASCVTLALIFVILTAIFHSFTQPLLVMLAIPFSLVGVLCGHLIMRIPIGAFSFIGTVALAGVVVNDSIVLIDFINRLRAQGENPRDSLIKGAGLRFRAILLTSVTTILGLSSIAFFPQGQAKFFSPMAVSLVFGLIFSTVLILIILPCLCAILDDCRAS